MHTITYTVLLPPIALHYVRISCPKNYIATRLKIRTMQLYATYRSPQAISQ